MPKTQNSTRPREQLERASFLRQQQRPPTASCATAMPKHLVAPFSSTPGNKTLQQQRNSTAPCCLGRALRPTACTSTLQHLSTCQKCWPPSSNLHSTHRPEPCNLLRLEKVRRKSDTIGCFQTRSSFKRGTGAIARRLCQSSTG